MPATSEETLAECLFVAGTARCFGAQQHLNSNRCSIGPHQNTNAYSDDAICKMIDASLLRSAEQSEKAACDRHQHDYEDEPDGQTETPFGYAFEGYSEAALLLWRSARAALFRHFGIDARPSGPAGHATPLFAACLFHSPSVICHLLRVQSTQTSLPCGGTSGEQIHRRAAGCAALALQTFLHRRDLHQFLPLGDANDTFVLPFSSIDGSTNAHTSHPLLPHAPSPSLTNTVRRVLADFEAFAGVKATSLVDCFMPWASSARLFFFTNAPATAPTIGGGGNAVPPMWVGRAPSFSRPREEKAAATDDTPNSCASSEAEAAASVLPFVLGHLSVWFGAPSIALLAYDCGLAPSADTFAYFTRRHFLPGGRGGGVYASPPFASLSSNAPIQQQQPLKKMGIDESLQVLRGVVHFSNARSGKEGHANSPAATVRGKSGIRSRGGSRSRPATPVRRNAALAGAPVQRHQQETRAGPLASAALDSLITDAITNRCEMPILDFLISLRLSTVPGEEAGGHAEEGAFRRRLLRAYFQTVAGKPWRMHSASVSFVFATTNGGHHHQNTTTPLRDAPVSAGEGKGVANDEDLHADWLPSFVDLMQRIATERPLVTGAHLHAHVQRSSGPLPPSLSPPSFGAAEVGHHSLLVAFTEWEPSELLHLLWRMGCIRPVPMLAQAAKAFTSDVLKEHVGDGSRQRRREGGARKRCRESTRGDDEGRHNGKSTCDEVHVDSGEEESTPIGGRWVAVRPPLMLSSLADAFFCGAPLWSRLPDVSIGCKQQDRTEWNVCGCRACHVKALRSLLAVLSEMFGILRLAEGPIGAQQNPHHHHHSPPLSFIDLVGHPSSAASASSTPHPIRSAFYFVVANGDWVDWDPAKGEFAGRWRPLRHQRWGYNFHHHHCRNHRGDALRGADEALRWFVESGVGPAEPHAPLHNAGGAFASSCMGRSSSRGVQVEHTPRPTCIAAAETIASPRVPSPPPTSSASSASGACSAEALAFAISKRIDSHCSQLFALLPEVRRREADAAAARLAAGLPIAIPMRRGSNTVDGEADTPVGDFDDEDSEAFATAGIRWRPKPLEAFLAEALAGIVSGVLAPLMDSGMISDPAALCAHICELRGEECFPHPLSQNAPPVLEGGGNVAAAVPFATSLRRIAVAEETEYAYRAELYRCLLAAICEEAAGAEDTPSLSSQAPPSHQMLAFGGHIARARASYSAYAGHHRAVPSAPSPRGGHRLVPAASPKPYRRVHRQS